MVDYDKSTGSSGTMRIRDTGTVVEFWISSGNSTTYNHQMPWKYYVNGVSSSWREYDYQAGSGFEKLGSWTVTTDQTVTFYLGDTGTSGLGGPTTFSKFIERASAPSPPSTPKVTVLSSTSVSVTFTDGANNGSAITSRQIGYGTSSTTVQNTVASDGSTTITGLTPGTTYYFWARTTNAKGTSGWSGRASAVTWRVPDAPSAVSLSDIKQTSVVAKFTGNGSGGTPVLEWQLGYGTASSTPTEFLSSNGTSTVTGLSPGRQYYFWARGRNSVGWGPWSTVSSATLVAGAWVKDSFHTWRRAVPYVRVNGVWKVARSWGKVAGTWRETL